MPATRARSTRTAPVVPALRAQITTTCSATAKSFAMKRSSIATPTRSVVFRLHPIAVRPLTPVSNATVATSARLRQTSCATTRMAHAFNVHPTRIATMECSAMARKPAVPTRASRELPQPAPPRDASVGPTSVELALRTPIAREAAPASWKPAAKSSRAARNAKTMKIVTMACIATVRKPATKPDDAWPGRLPFANVAMAAHSGSASQTPIVRDQPVVPREAAFAMNRKTLASSACLTASAHLISPIVQTPHACSIVAYRSRILSDGAATACFATGPRFA